jgi:hypothetical protein
MFGYYTPKNSADGILDCMPELGDQIFALPEPTANNLESLIRQFIKEKYLANETPGTREEGNIILVAKDKEYRPSPPVTNNFNSIPKTAFLFISVSLSWISSQLI